MCQATKNRRDATLQCFPRVNKILVNLIYFNLAIHRMYPMIYNEYDGLNTSIVNEPNTCMTYRMTDSVWVSSARKWDVHQRCFQLGEYMGHRPLLRSVVMKPIVITPTHCHTIHVITILHILTLRRRISPRCPFITKDCPYCLLIAFGCS